MDSGGLMSYVVNLVDQFRRSAGYVARSSRAHPAELPIQLPMNFELVINLRRKPLR